MVVCIFDKHLLDFSKEMSKLVNGAPAYTGQPEYTDVDIVYSMLWL